MRKIISLLLLFTLIFSACTNNQLIVKPDETTIQPNQPGSKTTEAKKSEEFSKRAEEAAKINEALASATPLMKQVSGSIETADKYCTKRFDQLFDREDISQLQIDFIESAKVQAELVRIINSKELTSKYTKEVKEFFSNARDDIKIHDWNGICKKDNEIYNFFTPVAEPAFIMNIWTEKGFSDFFKDENGKLAYFGGGATTFLPNALGKNSLMHTQGKDSPDYGWIIESFNPDKLLVNTIEECKLSFDFDADSNSKTHDINPAKYDLKCEKKYEP